MTAVSPCFWKICSARSAGQRPRETLSSTGARKRPPARPAAREEVREGDPARLLDAAVRGPDQHRRDPQGEVDVALEAPLAVEGIGDRPATRGVGLDPDERALALEAVRPPAR